MAGWTDTGIAPSAAVYLAGIGERLLAATEGARDDMHEPDEQGITARLRGRVLDNAGGDTEQTLVIRREVGDGALVTPINLAALIALARVGAHALGCVRPSGGN